MGKRFFGSYGGWSQLKSLAKEMKIDIAYWDENKRCKLKEKTSRYLFFRAEGGPVHLNASEIKARNGRPVIHVAYSEETPGHFEAYVSEESIQAFQPPEWL